MAQLDRVEVSDNVLGGAATGRGGGIRIHDANVTVTNSTISGNDGDDATGRGGALFASGNSSASFLSSTLASNSSPRAATCPTPVRALSRWTTRSWPTPVRPDVRGCDHRRRDQPRLQRGGIGTCPDPGADPALLPLAFNGGPTRTMDLSAGSAAIDAGSGCPAVDRRRFPRNVGACDLGAYEFGSTLNDVTPPACAISAIRADNPKQMDVAVSDDSSGLDSAPVTQQNGVINVPYFQRGSRNPVLVTATKVNQAQSTSWPFNASDQAGNTRLCT